MANKILYYIPGHSTNDTARELLPNRFGESFAKRDVARGPEGQPGGALFARDDQRLALKPDGQTWHEAGDKSFWFGWWNDAKPAPEDLLKPETLPGDRLNGWLVPRIKKWDLEQDMPVYSDLLPQRPRWDGSRFVRAGVVARFASVADLAAKVQDELRQLYFISQDDDADERRMVLPPDAPETAARILQINHAVGCDELAALEAFELEFEAVAAILKIFVSWDQYWGLLGELMEKKTLASASA